MIESPRSPIGRRQLWLGAVIFFVIGAAAMVYLQGSGLTSPTKYHGDLSQSPHWIAYHGDRFADDDLLVEYGAYNESPVQNAIYWVGTWFIDVILLNKIVGITIFGLTAALFFALVASVSGLPTGILAALFFLLFPQSSFDIAGGFSKAWAIGFVLISVYVIETRSWRVLPWFMPLAALTYPVSSVLTGAIVLVGIVMEYPRASREALRGFKYLVVSSALALLPLIYKYLTPPARIGPMTATSEMQGVWARGEDRDVTEPVWEELLDYFEFPFFIYSGFLLLMLLHGRGGVVWKRSWSAVVIASVPCYLVADLVMPRLYFPNRYTRYSLAVLLVLLFAHNWQRALALLKRGWVRHAAFAALMVFALVTFSNTFKPCDGDRALDVWLDKTGFAPLTREIAALPSPVFVAGHPYTMSEVVVQARQPVLVIHRMFHYWFTDYHREIDTRIRKTFRALLARRVSDVNELAERYGVTHLVVWKSMFDERRLARGSLYRPQFRELFHELGRGPRNFVLYPPPRDSVLFEDADFWLVRLPLEDPAAPGTASAPEPRGSDER